MKYILGIETSCDETAAALVSEDLKIYRNEISSQIHKHQEYGGVVPEIASRLHVANIYRVLELVLKDVAWENIAAIAVTYGPGLLGSLMIGITQAKMLSLLKSKPLIAINHMEGHIWANFLVHPRNYPFITLIVSGGHTEIVLVSAYGKYQLLAKTLDDAAGEAFDKVARLLELGYPGGPIIDSLARQGDHSRIVFPKANLRDGSDNFSFSGLKTAVINYYRKNPQVEKKDIAAAFQKAVIDTLVEKTFKLAAEHQIQNIFLSGGVSANSGLRAEFTARASITGKTALFPPMNLCTDNAAMIAAAAWEKYHNKDISSLSLKADPGSRLITIPAKN